MDKKEKHVCDECKHDRMNPNSVNDKDWCVKRETFVWPLEEACEDFELPPKPPSPQA